MRFKSVIFCGLLSGLSCFCGLAGVFAFSSFDTQSSGGGSSSSDSFINVGSVGLTAISTSTSVGLRGYAGFILSAIFLVDSPVTFLDASPASSEVQATAVVVCKITVESTGGSISKVWYRVSDTGPDEENFSEWRTDASTDSVIDPVRTRFMISLPSASTVYFSPGEDNYIQWRARNSGAAEAISGKYQVKVRSNSGGQFSVVITLPSGNGSYAFEKPLIEADINAPPQGVDAASIAVSIQTESGTPIANVNSVSNPEIYSLSTGKVRYQYAGAALRPGTNYLLTVSATDNLGNTLSAVETFKVRQNAISDIIPYPSPCDLKLKPLTIRYVISKDADVTLNAYGMSGKFIKNIVSNKQNSAGMCEETWNGESFSGDELANGIYYIEIVAKDADGEHRAYSSVAILGK